MIEVKVNPYRDKLESLLKKVRPRLSSTHNLEFKKCFGAVAGYVNGNIFISCGKFGVALKLPPEALAMLFKEKGGNHSNISPTAMSKKNMQSFLNTSSTNPQDLRNSSIKVLNFPRSK
jgi:hypothetical protein